MLSGKRYNLKVLKLKILREFRKPNNGSYKNSFNDKNIIKAFNNRPYKQRNSKTVYDR